MNLSSVRSWLNEGGSKKVKTDDCRTDLTVHAESCLDSLLIAVSWFGLLLLLLSVGFLPYSYFPNCY